MLSKREAVSTLLEDHWITRKAPHEFLVGFWYNPGDPGTVSGTQVILAPSVVMWGTHAEK